MVYKLWQSFDCWIASVDAEPEEFCQDIGAEGRTPQQALGNLLVELARYGKVEIMAHWHGEQEYLPYPPPKGKVYGV